MAKEQQNFSMYAGDSESLEFTVIDASTKLPVNLTGATVKWVMKKGINGDQIIFKNTSSGITITDAGNGKFTVSLTAGDTALVAPGGYYHATEIIDSLGNISMVSTGSAMIRARGISDGTPTTPAITMTTLEVEIGNLSTLTTTDKSSIVNAVNENVGKIGNLLKSSGTAEPTTGTWQMADKVWNTTPVAGGNLGWICVQAGTFGTGTPPVFKQFGIISA